VTLSVDASRPRRKSRSSGLGCGERRYIFDTMATRPQSGPPGPEPGLLRGLTLLPATALNMVDMIGVGPFITLPLMVALMHGPQASTAGLQAPCWRSPTARLGRVGRRHAPRRRFVRVPEADLRPAPPRPSALVPLRLPAHFQRARLHRHRMHRPVWLCRYVAPALAGIFWRATLTFPLLGAVSLPVEISGATLLAMSAAPLPLSLSTAASRAWDASPGTCRLACWLPSRSSSILGSHISNAPWRFRRLARLPHRDFARPFRRAAHRPLRLLGLLQHLLSRRRGRRAAQDHSRSMLLSIAAVACLYIVMNVSILGVMPAAEIAAMAHSTRRTS